MKKNILSLIFMLTLLVRIQPAIAQTVEYDLLISKERISVSGTPTEKITVNHTIPGPMLKFNEGDDAVIHVKNSMNEDTSIHWHGLLLPYGMDGVPGQGGFKGIKPGETFTYFFKIRQNGTYWYHAHSNGQEQDGLYGALVIAPKEQPIKSDYDEVILLSDYSNEMSSDILSNLKMSSDYYQYSRRTIGDFFESVKSKGFKAAFDESKMWGQMRMLPTDLSDVSQYTFLVNGKAPQQNWTGTIKRGETTRLRVINGSAMTIFDVRVPGLKLKVIASDGQPVEPFDVDEFRFAPGETYDFLVSPSDDKAYTFVAEPIDRTGFALGTLAPNEGMLGEIPTQRPRTLLTMADMGPSHNQSDTQNHSEHTGHQGHVSSSYDTGVKGSGWVRNNAPAGTVVLKYKDLRFLGNQPETKAPEKEIQVTLNGNMQRYIWMMNGKKFSESEPIKLKYGERVRLKFVNQTMMAHPMHLHGMFMQLENGQPANKLPNKHTIIIAPGDTYSALLTANEPGDWVFHCHLIYHMASGMMTSISVSQPSDTGHEMPHHVDHSETQSNSKPVDEVKPSETQTNQGEHHAH
jgi:FtsP/CotA-like multicopper oxidase with cupredoxin domain